MTWTMTAPWCMVGMDEGRVELVCATVTSRHRRHQREGLEGVVPSGLVTAGQSRAT